MRIFVTGATGFLGSAMVDKLLSQGYQVLGLARSKKSAETLIAQGAEVFYGDIDDLNGLQQAVQQADGIIHTAFNHDFSQFEKNCAADSQVITAIGQALKGSDRPFVITSIVGMGCMAPGEVARESEINLASLNPRKASELAGMTLIEQGINLSIVRLPQIHNTLKQGLISDLKERARQSGISAYVGQGEQCWAAVHLSDAASLYLLALERKSAGARYHAVAEEGVALKAIAQVLGEGLNVPVRSLTPEQAATHFGWLTRFVCHDMSASSELTQKQLAWQPTGPRLLTDLKQMQYH